MRPVVLLPQPLSPTRHTISPGSIAKRNRVDRGNPFAAAAKVFAYIPQFNNWRHLKRPPLAALSCLSKLAAYAAFLSRSPLSCIPSAAQPVAFNILLHCIGMPAGREVIIADAFQARLLTATALTGKRGSGDGTCNRLAD